MSAPQPAPTGAPGDAAEVRLDIDAAERAIVALEDVRRQIEDARAAAVQLAQTTPRTARDAVSMEAFDLLALQADGGPGSFTAAMDAGRLHVDELIVQLRADIAQQRGDDEAAAAEIKRHA